MGVDPVAHNRVAWDRQVDQGNEWSRPISAETVARARAGDWSVVLIGYQPPPDRLSGRGSHATW